MARNSLGVVAATAVLMTVLGGGSAVGQQTTTCEFNAGSGELRLRSTGTLTRVMRVSDEIRVLIPGQTITCSGSAPTVDAVDLIRVNTNAEFVIDLRNGGLGPGATDEGDGSSEIEIRAVFNRTGGVRVRGSTGPDQIHMGVVNGTRAINLNADESSPDADVTIVGGSPAISVLGRDGDDVISGYGGSGFDGPLETTTAISAGKGKDQVVGTDRRDLIGGGSGADIIDGKGGRDRIRSQAGNDVLKLRDGVRDVVTCGNGDDNAQADAVDKIRGCERVVVS